MEAKYGLSVLTLDYACGVDLLVVVWEVSKKPSGCRLFWPIYPFDSVVFLSSLVSRLASLDQATRIGTGCNLIIPHQFKRTMAFDSAISPFPRYRLFQSLFIENPVSFSVYKIPPFTL